MTKKLTKPIALFFTAFTVLVAALLHFGALDITTSAAWDGTVAAGFGGGDGSSAETACEIANGEQLARLAQDVNGGTTYKGKFFKLTANIDLGGNEWTPIGVKWNCFEGTFDGNGHTVSNFTINKPDESYLGLFGKNKGTIMNLGVEKAEINGYEFVGGVCGYNDGVKIQNCYNTGTVKGYNYVGGVCGFNCGTNYATIENCYNTGTVSGTEEIGGVCGYNDYNGTIQNCYNTGAVSGSKDIGGMCGNNNYSGTIKNCYNTGSVSGNGETSSAIGGVCGYRQGGTITNCYYNKDICTVGGINGEDKEGSATGLTTEQFCSGTLENLVGFDENVWNFGKSSDVTPTEEGSRFGTKTYTYPSLKGVGSAAETKVKFYNFSTSDSPEWQLFTEITTKDEFKNIGNDNTSWSKNYVLGANIDLDGEEITPIGNYDTPFTGKFSGDGHVVSNFKVNMPDDDGVGLFGKNVGLIMDLGVENAEVKGNDCVGSVCGANVQPGTVINCYNTGAVLGSLQVGGVCGITGTATTVKNCYNTGAVSGEEEVGGVCGSNSTGIVENCYNTGAVSGETKVGGVCGYNGGALKNCYNTGAVSGNSEKVGGVCGYNYETIENCYSIGAVSGGPYTGSVCGHNKGTVKNCYYNIDIATCAALGESVANAANDNEDNNVKRLTTADFCGGTLPTGFGSVWAEGSTATEASQTNVKFRKATYTYPSLNGVGTAYSVKTQEYNFKVNSADADDWQECTIITTTEQFKAIGENSESLGKNYVLDADIDFGGAEIDPIGNYYTHFTGKFSGNGHKIKNVKINKPDEDYIGLFSVNYGLIIDLYVENAKIVGKDIVGGICAWSSGSLSSDLAMIRNCVFTGTVQGKSMVGGICGLNGNSVIENCYSIADITGTSNVGGICGMMTYNPHGVSIKCCYSVGKVSGGDYDGYIYAIGSIVGFSDPSNSGVGIENCYYDKNVSSLGAIGTDEYDSSAADNEANNVKGLTTAELCGTTLPNGFGSVWAAGKIKTSEPNGKFRTVTYTYPSLNGVGTAYSVEKNEYNFKTPRALSDDWQEYTLIENEAQFIAIGNDSTSWGKNYVLAKELNLSGKTITPIGNNGTSFTGKFSGNGYTIKNVKMSTDEDLSGGYGLFGVNTGLIMNLAVEGDISYTLSNGRANVGGICGKNDIGGKIFYCSFEGKVYNGGNDAVGGICGENKGWIEYCCAFADVTSDRNVAGGICGRHDDYSGIDSDIYYCYFVGKVSINEGNDDSVGAIVASSTAGTRYLNCYYDKERSNVVDNELGVGKTTKELCEAVNLFGSYEKTWTTGSYAVTPDAENSNLRTVEYTYPKLVCLKKAAKSGTMQQYNFKTSDTDDWQECTVITTAEQFKNIGNDNTSWSKNYILGADIDLGGEEITPIGNFANPFTGKFSGNGHTVSNFTINQPYKNNIGLFGYNNGTIMNLGVEKAEITGYNFVGGVCGENYGTIKNCYNTGTVSGNGETTSSDIGGVCGENYGTIEDCYNTGTVSGTGYVGGVCGYNEGGTIQSCYNTGAVSGESTVGGVCGYKYGGTITNCYYNKDICTVGGIGYGEGSATGLTTLQMTDGKALKTMKFDSDDSEWSKKANDKANGIAYYPNLAVFADDAPSVKYETKIVIEPSNKDAEYKYGDEVKFNVSALVKFDGMADFAADNTAATESEGSFKITVDGDTVVDSTDIFDNTTTEGVIPSINVAGNRIFTLEYDGTNSEYIANGEATCKVNIEKLDLSADKIDFTPPTNLIFDGKAKSASFSGKSGVGEINAKYYLNGVETQPINAGTYAVKINVAEGDIYKSATDLTSADWTFTIEKATAPAVKVNETSAPWNKNGSRKFTITGLPENHGGFIGGKATVTENSDNIIGNTASFSGGVLTYTLNKLTAADLGKTATVELEIETNNYTTFSVTVEITVTKMTLIAPTNVRVRSDDGRLVISWSEVENAEFYRVQWLDGTVWRTVGQTKNLSYGVKSVVSGETYTYRVLAGDESSYGPASASASATYSAVPKNVKATAENKRTTLTWNKVTNASEYRVQMLKNGVWSTVGTPAANTLVVKNLTNGTKYSFRVLAKSGGVWSIASAVVTATPNPIPTNVSAAAGNKSITLTWDKLNEASEYRVQMLKNNAWTTIALPTANTYTVKNLTNGTMYSFKVLANVDGKWSVASIVVTAKPDLIPANFRAVVAGKSITLRWTALSGATRYRIQRLSDSTWSTIGYAGGTSFVDKNVESGKSYSYRIICFDGTAWHTPSAAITGSMK